MKTTYRLILIGTIVSLFFLPHRVSAQSGELEQVILDMIQEVSEANLSDHILTLQYAGGTQNRVTFTPGVDSASVYVKEQFDAISGLTSVEYDTFYIPTAVAPYNEQPQVNVIATIEGQVYPEKTFVIGAHIDATADRDINWGDDGANWQTIAAPGADDNATGVASILEIARILTDPAFHFISDYTIKLVGFGAEERLPAIIYSGSGGASNHHGSIHYAERASENDEEIIGMVSVDMIGYNDDYDYTAIVFDPQTGTLNSKAIALGNQFFDANIDFAIGLIMNEPPFATGSYSDHQSFADEGFPAILMIENAPPWSGRDNDYYSANPYYHKSSDTYNRLNMGLVKKVTQLSLATAASMGSVATSIDDRYLSENPENISLFQNYPNPFNPSTVISFELPENAHVTLEVFDMLGRRVTTLVNEQAYAGRHTVTFDASRHSGMSSGSYFYRLQAGEINLTRTMMLVK